MGEMLTGSGQFSLRALLVTVAVIMSFIGLYVHVWRFDAFLPALFTTAVTAASFLAIQRCHQANERLGAVIGGAVGGILSIALHKIACDAHLPGVFEDEGLGVAGVTLLFSPVGAVFGVLVGLFVWMLAYLHKLDATAPLPSAPPDRTSRPLQRP
jgi:O-antigen/teichoic acid export membrane protein